MDITWIIWSAICIGMAVTIYYLFFKKVLQRDPDPPQNIKTVDNAVIYTVTKIIVRFVILVFVFLGGNKFGYITSGTKVYRPQEGVVYKVIQPSYVWETNTFAVLQIMEHNKTHDVWFGRSQPVIYQVPNKITDTSSRIIAIKGQNGRVELLPHPLRAPEEQFKEVR